MNLFCIILNTLIVWTNGMPFTYQWKFLNFTFPYYEARTYAEQNGYLRPENAVPFDVQPYFDKQKGARIFITVPRFKPGIPYTLATFHKEDPLTAELKPYPTNYLQNNYKGQNCRAITSATRLAINECNEMWVIDTGMEGSNDYCPPKLMLIDLNTDQVKRQFYFTRRLYASRASLFTNLIVDVSDPPPHGNCQRTMVYVADSNYGGLVVYDYLNNKAWRIENRFMNPEPRQGLLSVAGERFVSMDGIYGMATDKKYLYFHPLASKYEYAVSLNVLNNSTLFKKNKRNMQKAFYSLGKRNSACAASAMDSKNNLYCVTLDPIELIKWNVNTAYDGRNIEKLPIYSPHLEFVSSMKVVGNNSDGNENLWMLSNRYQKIATGTQNTSEVNCRIVVHFDIL